MDGMGTIEVLHVDDDPAFLDLTARRLERLAPELAITRETSARKVLDRLSAEESVDCVISDYEMPGMDGLELLAAVRKRHPRLPFLLFTGKGSEAIAGEAINAGVSGYLQKGSGETYDLLVNRVRNAVERHRAIRRAERFETVLAALGYPTYVVDGTGRFTFVDEAFAELTGYDRERLLGSRPSLVKSDDGVQTAREHLGRVLSSDGPDVAHFEIDIHTADGEVVRCRDHMGVLPYEGEQFRGSVGILRPLSDSGDRPGRT